MKVTGTSLIRPQPVKMCKAESLSSTQAAGQTGACDHERSQGQPDSEEDFRKGFLPLFSLSLVAIFAFSTDASEAFS